MFLYKTCDVENIFNENWNINNIYIYYSTISRRNISHGRTIVKLAIRREMKDDKV